MIRAALVWVVVVVGGLMILPAAIARMIDFPWFYAPLVALWLVGLLMAGHVTRAALKHR